MKCGSFIATEPEQEGLKERWRARAGVDADGMLHEEEKQGTEPTKLSPRRILTGAALAGSRRKKEKLMSKQSKRKMRSKKKRCPNLQGWFTRDRGRPGRSCSFSAEFVVENR